MTSETPRGQKYDFAALNKHAERFHTMYQRVDGECWPWIGPLFSMGYGRFDYEHKSVVASRVMMVLLRGKEGK